MSQRNQANFCFCNLIKLSKGVNLSEKEHRTLKGWTSSPIHQIHQQYLPSIAAKPCLSLKDSGETPPLKQRVKSRPKSTRRCTNDEKRLNRIPSDGNFRMKTPSIFFPAVIFEMMDVDAPPSLGRFWPYFLLAKKTEP